MIYALLICFIKEFLTSALPLQEMVCNSGMKGSLRSMLQERTSAPGLAFQVVKMAGLMECIIVNNPSSIQWWTSCGVFGN